MKSTTLAAGAAALAIVAAGIWWAGGSGSSSATAVAVAMPALTGSAAAGQEPFARYCAECHGENGGGTAEGPPLVHPYYEPSHHADFAFARAVRQGAPAHHWEFGDMPAVDAVGDAELRAIIDYVRAVQRANGIE